MKKYFYIVILIVLYFLSTQNTISQNKYGENPDECKKNLKAFYNLAKFKDYENAFEPWKWSFVNCPKSAKTIYRYGLKIAEDRYSKAIGDQKQLESERIDKIYAQRILYFPENLGKVFSDWASSLEKREARKEQVFEKLELAFQIDPAQMSIKNIAKYFQRATNFSKEINPQKIFDTHDDILEAVYKKVEYHSKSLDSLNNKKSLGKVLSDKEKIQLKNHTINLRGLGQIEGVLDGILKENSFVSCEQLLPLYKKRFETHKTDAKWLRRTVSRLNHKECTESDLYKKLLEAYVKVDYSPDAAIIRRNIYGRNDPFIDSPLKKMIDAEKDPYKKADYFYKMGRNYRRSSPSTAASYSKQALKHRPSMGKAYLLIASAYAASANSCGKDEFSKRMVFVAAANKAKKAKEVDPSITSITNKYIKSYLANAPSRNLHIPAGEEFKIGCWINETVKIP